MKPEDFIKSSNDYTAKGDKHYRSSKKRVPETQRSLKRCTRSASRSFSIKDDFARKRRNADTGTNRQQQKLYPACRNRRNTNNEDCGKLKLLLPRKRSKNNNGLGKIRVVVATILSWLIDAGKVQENAEVYSMYEAGKQMKKRGLVKRKGILCFCCNKVFPISKFHQHSGRSCTKPYENIFVARTKVPLISYMIEAWNAPQESQSHGLNDIEMKGDFYDDACMVCADGGNLMCCEECSSTYHQVCMGMQDVPEDSWYCPYCVCKFCAQPSREHDCLLACPQCEKRYHWECHRIKEQGMDLNRIPLAPFCEQSCKEVFDKLTNTMVGKRNELDEGYSWTLLHQMDNEFDTYIDDKYSRMMCHSKLVAARMLMEECFEPIQDRHTTVKVIPSVIYNCGANIRRVSFKGFYTAVLEKDDEIISVASLRIHGTKLAEMPFIATNEAFRCRGMCRKLMAAIESMLCYLRVENLIIPSVPERIGSWISGHGFGHLDTAMKHEIMLHNTLMFHDSVRLQKPLPSRLTRFRR